MNGRAPAPGAFPADERTPTCKESRREREREEARENREEVKGRGNRIAKKEKEGVWTARGITNSIPCNNGGSDTISSYLADPHPHGNTIRTIASTSFTITRRPRIITISRGTLTMGT